MKKAIVLKDMNREKIENELNNVQRRCSVRMVSFDDIVKTSKEIREFYKLNNKELNGCRFVIDLHAQTFPGTYKYTPESTKFILEFKNSYWKLVDVFRGITNRDGGVVETHLTEEAEKALIEYFTNPY